MPSWFCHFPSSPEAQYLPLLELHGNTLQDGLFRVIPKGDVVEGHGQRARRQGSPTTIQNGRFLLEDFADPSDTGPGPLEVPPLHGDAVGLTNMLV